MMTPAERMREMARVASASFSDGTHRVHPEVAWSEMAPNTQRLSHAVAQNIAEIIAALPLPADDRDAEIARLRERVRVLEETVTVAAATMDAMHLSENQLTDAEVARLWNATREKIDAALGPQS